ncbi:UV DNA damage repair endonuclease UvsE [Aneurinibacillus sp. Ricciae_BoGa-3]|uniref:UV DNA damage repair endonuclease UvsE n=1 Tax=Aneurinibacillus sp. Ricciae_BoGa-3 TaxID=3022697 RepID=UPI00234082FF|nr:UV DNA damage repair endonuclease UvsE [Aneurinibacillus sp. Ricciae_BoGa-3]WCK54039.1 UV DNA damage repair endonuclease UvsE [Aneurinibacillus sp. Ricciae_BoGa-3]
MEVRLGYVAMSVHVANASPSKTMTAAQFDKIGDKEAGLHKLERIAEENIHNCIRLLYHNRAYNIKFFRLSSRLIPLVGHEYTHGWNYMDELAPHFQKLGEVAREDGVRIDFHPDHFVLLNSPRKQVFDTSHKVLEHHIRMLTAMSLSPKHRCVMHVGGAYSDKEKALKRFVANWDKVSPEVRQAIMLENDDKVYTARDTLMLCETLGIPMVLDIHHHRCNPGQDADISSLLPRILATWSRSSLPPKMHISSPRSDKNKRAHADYIRPEELFPFLKEMARMTERLDIMVEAKQKDDAVLRLMDWVKREGEVHGIQAVNGGAFTV